MIKLLSIISLFFLMVSCGTDASKPTTQTTPEQNQSEDIVKAYISPIVYQESANIPKLTSGYGSFGKYEVATEEIANTSYPAYADKNLKTTLFFPKDLHGTHPTLFFYAGAEVYDANTYKSLFYFVASKGYNIIFLTYPNYELRELAQATQEALDAFSMHIDRTKVGFLGHSMGAGITFWIINQFPNLGSEGRFLFPMASGYSAFNVSNMIPLEKTISLPANTKMFLQMYAKDYSTDVRIGIDLFLNNSIDIKDKAFIYVYGDENHIANHSAMAGTSYDAMQQRAIFRPLDALMDETFNHNAQARETLISQNANDPYFHPYIGTTPQIDIRAYILPEEEYPFNCSEAQAGHYISKRKEYCKALGL
jgi:pimeloyl-ACP methyl ester carboxylesterase